MGFGGVKGFGDDPDDDDDDLTAADDEHELGHRALPDPLDRLWLHPSELAAPAPPTPPRTRSRWPATLLAGAAGAVLTLAVLGAVGALGGSSNNDSNQAAVS